MGHDPIRKTGTCTHVLKYELRLQSCQTNQWIMFPDHRCYDKPGDRASHVLRPHGMLDSSGVTGEWIEHVFHLEL